MFVLRATPRHGRSKVLEHGTQVRVPKLVFDRHQTCPAIEKVRRERVTEQMRKNSATDLRPSSQDSNQFSHVAGCKAISLSKSREEILARVLRKLSQVLHQGPRAVGGHIDHSIFPIFSSEHRDSVSAEVDILEFQIADFLVANARVRQEANHAPLTDIFRRDNQPGDFGLGERVFDNTLRLFRSTDLNFAALKAGVVFNGETRIDDVRVAVLFFVHPQNVGLDMLILGNELSHPAKRDAQGPAVTLNGHLRQPSINDQMFFKSLELPLQFRMIHFLLH